MVQEREQDVVLTELLKKKKLSLMHDVSHFAGRAETVVLASQMALCSLSLQSGLQTVEKPAKTPNFRTTACLSIIEQEEITPRQPCAQRATDKKSLGSKFLLQYLFVHTSRK